MAQVWPVAILGGIAVAGSLIVGVVAVYTFALILVAFVSRTIIGTSSEMYIAKDGAFHHHHNKSLHRHEQDVCTLVLKTRIGGYFRRTRIIHGPVFWPVTISSWNGRHLTLAVSYEHELNMKTGESVTADAESVLRLYAEGPDVVNISNTIGHQHQIMKSAVTELLVLHALAFRNDQVFKQADNKLIRSRLEAVLDRIPCRELEALKPDFEAELHEHDASRLSRVGS